MERFGESLLNILDKDTQLYPYEYFARAKSVDLGFYPQSKARDSLKLVSVRNILQRPHFHSLQLLPNIRTIIVENAHCNPAVFNESGLADYIETAPQPLSIQFERCADTLVSFARSFSRLSERKVLWNNEELQHK
jgi:hypothetical protein